MIATIVCGLVIIVCIVAIVVGYFGWSACPSNENWYVTICASLCIMWKVSICLVISLTQGYYNVDSDAKREFEKNKIVEMLEECPNDYNTIILAKEHNYNEKNGNNYWCRFRLRKEYLIDIRLYLYNGNKGDKMDGIANSDCKFYDFGKQYIELKEGSIVEVIGKSEDYYVVRWNGTTGLIDKKYIDLQE